MAAAPRIAVIDYAKGNLKSVERGLQRAGAAAFITDDPDRIMGADALVLPGVGAFADAMAGMDATGQRSAILTALDRGKPFLGICLGLQLLFANGMEGAPEGGPLPKGLGIIAGTAVRMPKTDARDRSYKVPHVGWNSIEFDPSNTDCALLDGVKPGEYFYFTHSYIAPENHATVATTTHSVTFPSVIQASPTVFGVQFHPEKSSDAGARVLDNYVDIVRNC